MSENKNMTVPAYAKINWSLRITGVKDGYHELDMIMDSVSLCDTLFLERTDDGIVTVDAMRQVARMQDNLIWRAAKALQEYTGTGYGVRVQIQKRIPSGAGLGGGSSDAAATLLGLNELWELRLDRSVLERIGLSIGSDVPYCVRQGRQRAKGRGQILSACGGTAVYHLVLVKDEESSPTGPVYKEYDCNGSDASFDQEELIAALASGDPQQVAEAIGQSNDLALAATRICPQILSTMRRLQKTQPLASWVTGSGAACVGIFRSQQDAKRAENELRKKGLWCCAVETRKGTE